MNTIDKQIDDLLKAHADMSIEKIRAFVESLPADNLTSQGVAEYVDHLKNPLQGKNLITEVPTVFETTKAALECAQRHEPQKLNYVEILKNIKTQ